MDHYCYFKTSFLGSDSPPTEELLESKKGNRRANTALKRDKRRDCTRMVSRRHAQAKRLRKLFINHTPFSLRRKIPKEVQNYAGQYALFII
ncbi:hypothetical protein OUZ56_006045 [Daphnia magna]|uniref:Uncharacterized protein n=1 Tax=Daphnia magna TaxID=35525 RepID=A0ABQ9YUL3_9CRUS|nr:hypothetical protein OUZ56_006045 [Daphnia magna]